MPDRIELSKSGFVSVMAYATGPCSHWLPGDRGTRGWIELPPEVCVHWPETVAALMGAADQLVERALDQYELGEQLGSTEAAAVANRSRLRALIDEICGTPPRWPIGWPPRSRLDAAGLIGPQVLVVAARFQAAADHVGEHPLAGQFADAADELFDIGLKRLVERGA